MRNRLSVILCFFSGFSIIIGFLNAHSSVLMKDYVCVPGWISDVETTSVYKKGGQQIRYHYVIHWYADGEYYSRQVNEAMNAPDDSISEVWADPHNETAIASDPKESKKEALFQFTLAILLSVTAWICHKKSNDRLQVTRDTWENIHTYAFLLLSAMLIGAALMLAVLCTASDLSSYMHAIITDLLAIFLILAVGSGIAIRKAKKHL